MGKGVFGPRTETGSEYFGYHDSYSRLSKKFFVGFHMACTSRDFVARGRPLRGQKRLAPLAKRSTCSKSTVINESEE